jgi:squalene-hopene/tetraprenyl-beta-curcumene cyclase
LLVGRPAPAKTPAPTSSDSRARDAAQRGLEFLSKEAIAWQTANHCYGCHVQAVTLEAMTVGLHNQYQVRKPALDQILAGMTTGPGGSRGPNGLSVNGDPHHLIETAKDFGGAAFARYDEWVDGKVRDDLFTTARALLGFQNPDGSVRTTDQRLPVVAGPLQATSQALATWSQAYARSADDAWLSPMRRAEEFLMKSARAQSAKPIENIQEVNYALMGLLRAGARGSEATVIALAKSLAATQRKDGGFGFGTSDESNPLATGQTLYTLRLAGWSDNDTAIQRGTAWLISHQATDGGWSHAGFGKAEAMWAVLGLVSVDVLSIRISGVEDGAHVDGAPLLVAHASDNQGGAVSKIQIAIDDVPAASMAGPSIEFAWDTAKLEPGKHIIDAIATNARGKTSRRRIEVYAGNVYLTQIGSHYDDGGTVITARDIAAAALAHKLRLDVYAVDEKTGVPAKAKKVATLETKGQQGPVSLYWNGKDASGKALPRAKYIAAITLLSQDRALETEELLFLHDTPEAQREAFGEVQGALKDGDAPLANTKVDLVDEKGRTVQSVMSTDSGQWRFKNVDPGKYHVRVQKRGFEENDAPVTAAAKSESNADVQLTRH